MSNWICIRDGLLRHTTSRTESFRGIFEYSKILMYLGRDLFIKADYKDGLIRLGDYFMYEK
ncbi:hypothetical protein EHQ07_10880, partial [Leptospira gomenensis]